MRTIRWDSDTPTRISRVYFTPSFSSCRDSLQQMVRKPNIPLFILKSNAYDRN
nr:MAG TPA: hypothetical protein [Caudoviricetes sp.]